VKATAFEEKAKETTVVVKEDPTSPKRPKPGNIASRVAGLNIDPTKLKQGAYDAAKMKKKKKMKQKPSQSLHVGSLQKKCSLHLPKK